MTDTNHKDGRTSVATSPFRLMSFTVIHKFLQQRYVTTLVPRYLLFHFSKRGKKQSIGFPFLSRFCGVDESTLCQDLIDPGAYRAHRRYLECTQPF